MILKGYLQDIIIDKCLQDVPLKAIEAMTMENYHHLGVGEIQFKVSQST